MYGKMILAPPSTMVKYLAILHRFFVAARDAADSNDPFAIVMIGHLADALHNVPQILWCHDPNAWWKPDDIDRWVRTFPDVMHQRAAPETIVAMCRSVVSFDGDAQNLDFLDDLAEFDLAPPDRLDHYLKLIANSLTEMRQVRSSGVRSGQPWDEIREKWSPEASEAGRFNGLLGAAMLPLPKGLVHWSGFSEAEFYARAAGLVEQVPERYREYWVRFFTQPQKE